MVHPPRFHSAQLLPALCFIFVFAIAPATQADESFSLRASMVQQDGIDRITGAIGNVLYQSDVFSIGGHRGHFDYFGQQETPDLVSLKGGATLLLHREKGAQVIGQAQMIVYHPDRGVIQLYGDAVLDQEGVQVHSEYLEYWVEDQRIQRRNPNHVQQKPENRRRMARITIPQPL